MATSTLAKLPSLPQILGEVLLPARRPTLEFLVFPNRTAIYTWRIVAVETNRTISRHMKLSEALRKCALLNRGRLTEIETEPAKLQLCDYEEPESSYGACDGGHPCAHLGTVYHIDSELTLCPKHFEMSR